MRNSQSQFTSVLRRAALPAFAVAVIALFGAYAIVGPNGALAFNDYKRQLAAHGKRLSRLEQERADLQNRVNLLDPHHANPDMVDELVRKQLNVAHPDEVIVPIK